MDESTEKHKAKAISQPITEKQTPPKDRKVKGGVCLL